MRLDPVADNMPTAKWRHDLKNQLGIVLGYSELLLQDLDQANPMRTDIEEIRRRRTRRWRLSDRSNPPTNPADLLQTIETAGLRAGDERFGNRSRRLAASDAPVALSTGTKTMLPGA
jgi:hypothetical protein